MVQHDFPARPVKFRAARPNLSWRDSGWRDSGWLGRGWLHRGWLGRRILTLYTLLILANLGSWLWALSSFRHFPLLLDMAFLAYSLGLRHAVDADHIAAIDNVTRKLMQDGKRPIGTGFFFSLGHSSVVTIATIVVAVAASVFKDQLRTAHAWGGMIGTMVSASFLLILAAINVVILIGIYRVFRRVARGGRYVEEDLDVFLAQGGLLARVFCPMFKLITKSWHMFPLGFLFGLGFDTASEIGLLGIAAAEAAKGLTVWSILIFPALFTAGMTLVDTTDSILMLGAYGWAFVKPIRKLFYNMTITFTSVLAAAIVGGIELMGLIAREFSLSGGAWDVVAKADGHLGIVGYVIIGVFVLSWIVSVIIYRVKDYDALELTHRGSRIVSPIQEPISSSCCSSVDVLFQSASRNRTKAAFAAGE